MHLTLLVVERVWRLLRVRPSVGGVFEIGELPVTALRASYPSSRCAREDSGLGITLNPQFDSGTSIKLVSSVSKLRAVATDAKGAVAVGRVPLIQEESAPALQFTVARYPSALGFGEDLKFSVKGVSGPSKVVVRAYYIPPTGHDAGGPQFSEDVFKLVTS